MKTLKKILKIGGSELITLPKGFFKSQYVWLEELEDKTLRIREARIE